MGFESKKIGIGWVHLSTGDVHGLSVAFILYSIGTHPRGSIAAGHLI